MSLYCVEVNSFCKTTRFTQGLMPSGLSSPEEVKGCNHSDWRALDRLSSYLHSEKWCSTTHTTVWCLRVWEAKHVFPRSPCEKNWWVCNALGTGVGNRPFTHSHSFVAGMNITYVIVSSGETSVLFLEQLFKQGSCPTWYFKGQPSYWSVN